MNSLREVQVFELRRVCVYVYLELMLVAVLAGETAAMGYSWAGEVPVAHSLLHQRLHSGRGRVRHHQ